MISILFPGFSDVEDKTVEEATGIAIGPLTVSLKVHHPKRGITTIAITLLMAVSAFSQGIPTRGPTPPPELTKALDQFNADVAAWNKRCLVTRSKAEDAWCKKERTRIDARRAELIALGAVPK